MKLLIASPRERASYRLRIADVDDTRYSPEVQFQIIAGGKYSERTRGRSISPLNRRRNNLVRFSRKTIYVDIVFPPLGDPREVRGERERWTGRNLYRDDDVRCLIFSVVFSIKIERAFCHWIRYTSLWSRELSASSWSTLQQEWIMILLFAGDCGKASLVSMYFLYYEANNEK